MLSSKCQICAAIFEPDKWHKQQKFCSASCRQVAGNKKNSVYKKQWTSNNKLSVVQAKRVWIEKNPEKRKAASEKYRKEHASYYTQYASLRTRKQLQAKPKCLSEFDELFLLEFYDLAKRRGLEVDHIIPLQHKLVCGLHVPANLQMLTRSENAKKSNRFDEDVVAIVRKNHE